MLIKKHKLKEYVFKTKINLKKNRYNTKIKCSSVKNHLLMLRAQRRSKKIYAYSKILRSTSHLPKGRDHIERLGTTGILSMTINFEDGQRIAYQLLTSVFIANMYLNGNTSRKFDQSFFT